MSHVETITVSALVSGIVSAVTGAFVFAAGARSQKNVADRPILKQTYQSLFGHFTEIEKQFEAGRPLTWADFKLIRNEFCPMVREMEVDGRANLLPAELFQALKETERKAITAGGRLVDAVKESVVPQFHSIMTERVRSPTSSVSGHRYLILQIVELVLDPSELRGADFGPKLGLGVATPVGGGRSLNYYASPETVVRGSVSELVTDIADLANLPEIADVKNEVLAAREAVASARQLLEARIRDPHPFHEAIAETLRDVAFFPRASGARKL